MQVQNNEESLRGYCFDCNQLFVKTKSRKHCQHNVKYNISSEDLNHPMSLLVPLSNNKKEAQYLFTKQCVKEMTDIVFKLGYW